MILLVNSKKNDYFPIRFQLGHNNNVLSRTSLTVKFSSQKKCVIRLQLVDVSGNILQEFVYPKKDSEKYSADFNVTDLASGIYYFKILAGKKSEIREMFLRN